MFTSMDLKVKIEELRKDLIAEELKKSIAHEKIKAIKRKIGMLETRIEDIEDILNEDRDKEPKDN